MNKEYLNNYAKEELYKLEQHYKKIRANNIEDAEGYPDKSRFSKTNNPLVLCETATYRQYGEKIWSQIPFAGTLIIPLSPATEENFLREQGFDVNDIDKMINLAKDRGRIQFVLPSEPTDYEGLDHLQPIFQELRPPILTIPWNFLQATKNMIIGTANSTISPYRHTIQNWNTE